MSFIYGEMELAQASGLDLGLFRKARKKMAQGSDWDLNKMRVAYSSEGVARVLELVISTPPTAEALTVFLETTQLDKPRKKTAELLSGTVVRLGGPNGQFRNPWFIEVALPNGTRTMVRVKTTKNFRRGMVCPLRVNDGRHELARRLPRFPGRW